MSRVVLVSEARRFGGAEIYLERLATALPGWSAKVAVPEHPSLAEWKSRLETMAVPVIPYSPTMMGWNGLAKRLREEADLIHVNLPNTYDGAWGAFPAAVSVLSGKPVVTSEHLIHIPRSRRRRWVKLRAASRVRAVIATCRAGKHALVAEGMDPKKIAVIPNGVPDPGGPAPFPIDASPLVVGVLVRLEPRKQVDLLIRAVSGCTDTQIRLEVGGDGPSRGGLERLVRELGLEDRVRFHGSVHDAGGFLGRSHVVALPSRLEGMPLVVLDAFSKGRGVLASDIPGMEEIVSGETGQLLPCSDPSAWSEALREASRSPERVRAWGKQARERFERFYSLDRCASETARFYDRVLRDEPVDA